MRGMKRLAAMAVIAAAVVPVPGVAQAAERSPSAELLGAKLVSPDAVDVRFRLTCPKRDTYTVSMLTLQAAPPEIPTNSDVKAVGTGTGTCKGSPQLVTLRLINGGSDYQGEPVSVPLRKGCGIEYGVTFTGTDWQVAFDAGGATGGGPPLCFK